MKITQHGKIFEAECSKCGKKMESLSRSQVEWNMGAHERSCTKTKGDPLGTDAQVPHAPVGSDSSTHESFDGKRLSPQNSPLESLGESNVAKAKGDSPADAHFHRPHKVHACENQGGDSPVTSSRKESESHAPTNVDASDQYAGSDAHSQKAKARGKKG